MHILTLLLYGFVAFIVAVIAFLNVDTVSVNYYFGQINLSLPVLAIGLFIFGMLLGFGMHIIGALKLRLENRNLRRKLRLAEEELSKLRLLSIGESA